MCKPSMASSNKTYKFPHPCEHKRTRGQARVLVWGRREGGGGARKRGRASDGGECHTWCFDPGKATLLGWSARSPTVGRLKWRAFRGRRESVHERGGGRPSGGAGIGHAVQIRIILLEQGRGRLESVHEQGGGVDRVEERVRASGTRVPFYNELSGAGTHRLWDGRTPRTLPHKQGGDTCAQ